MLVSSRWHLRASWLLPLPALALAFGGCVAQEPYEAPGAAGLSAQPGGGASGSLNVDPSEGGTDSSDAGAPAVEDGLRCTSSAMCGPPLPYCASGLQRCVACLSNANCVGTTGHYCDPKSFQCVTCLKDEHCSSLAPYCSSSVGACVQCLTTTNCGDPGLACDRVNFRCVPSCETNGDCAATVDTPFCDPARSLCVACVADGDCSAPAPRCAVEAGSCVQCLADTDCPTALPRCDLRQHKCLQCLGARDCSPGSSCVSGSCVNPK